MNALGTKIRLKVFAGYAAEQWCIQMCNCGFRQSNMFVCVFWQLLYKLIEIKMKISLFYNFLFTFSHCWHIEICGCKCILLIMRAFAQKSKCNLLVVMDLTRILNYGVFIGSPLKFKNKISTNELFSYLYSVHATKSLY